MKTGKWAWLPLIAGILLVSATSAAGWLIDIQESKDNVYDLVLLTDKTLSFAGGQASFLYDNADTLDWTYTFSYPSPLEELSGAASEETPGDIGNLAGGSLTGTAAVTGDTVLATFTFTGSGDANFRFDLEDPDMNFEINDVIYSSLAYPEVFGGSGLPVVSLSEIDDQATNINTPTEPIAIDFYPNETARVILSAASSNTGLLPDAAIEFFADEKGTAIANPLAVSLASEMTLFVVATPTGNQAGTATITVTLTDASDTGNRASVEFDLTVALAEATLRTSLDGENAYRNQAVRLQGTKGQGSAILLQVDGGSATRIVDADTDEDWSYVWDPGADGNYAYALINQAGTVREVFASGTLVVDTQPPVVPIEHRKVTRIGYDYTLGYGETIHYMDILATAPDDADSSRFLCCLDNQKIQSDWAAYGESYTDLNGVDDGEEHQAVPIPRDLAGNEQVDCSGNPVRWRFEADKEQFTAFDIFLVTPDAGDAYVRLEWALSSPAGKDVRVWARTCLDDDYVELPGTPVKDSSVAQADASETVQVWAFEDTTTPARIRSYMLTDSTGNETLADFERLDDPDESDTDPSNQDPDPSTGGGGGGGGCFIESLGTLFG